MYPITTCNEATHAIKAAKNKKNWGSFMARAFCRNRQVNSTLYRLACQLEAASKAGF